MNIAGSAIDRRAKPVQRIRSVVEVAEEAYDEDGEFVPPGPANVSILAVVQPASGRQLMDVPEGYRAEARYFIWSRSDLQIDDVIAVAGLSYRVIYVWPRSEGEFYRAAMGELA